MTVREPSAAIRRVMMTERAGGSAPPGPGVIRMQQGDPDFPTPAHIVEALADALEAGYTRYPPYQGDPDLRAVVADQLSQRTGDTWTAADVVITNGGTGAVFASMTSFLDPGDQVLIPDPNYSLYGDVALAVGAEPTFVRGTSDFHLDLDRLKRWLRYWTMVRHRDGAERTLLTAVASGATPAQLADLLFSAATDRAYADVGHLLDFCNKAFELLDLIGWEHAGDVLPSVIERLVRARGGEETDAWRHPVDLVPVLREAADELPRLLEEGAGKTWDGVAALSGELLGEEPLAIVAALREAIRGGARPEQLTKALAYAAALRIARFGKANEFGDWITALHTFTYCNALQQAVKRCPTPDLLRGIFHGAMSVYLDRFLNVPPARLPGEGGAALPDEEDAAGLLSRLLGLLDRRDQEETAVGVVARYLRQGHAVSPLLDALARATVREDADFHTFQMLEAGIQQYREWQGRPEGEHILVAVARFLAAHSPTQRARWQTSEVALRLHRGESLYDEDETLA